MEKKCIRCDNICYKRLTESVEYFCFKRKYCSVSCGLKKREVSPESRLRHSIAAKKVNIKPPLFSELSLEKQKIIREKLSQYPSPMLGKFHSKEAKIKNSNAHKREKSPTWKGGVTFAKNYKRMKKMEYLGRRYNAEGSHTLEDWNNLKKLYKYMCLCCKKQEPDIILTEDHIIPLIKGGSDYIENIQPLCMPCNSRKNIKIVNYRNFVLFKMKIDLENNTV